MSMTRRSKADKSDSLENLESELSRFVNGAAESQVPMGEFEQRRPDRLLAMGKTLVDWFRSAQGDDEGFGGSLDPSSAGARTRFDRWMVSTVLGIQRTSVCATSRLHRITLTRGRGGSARAHHPWPPRARTRHDFSKTALRIRLFVDECEHSIGQANNMIDRSRISSNLCAISRRGMRPANREGDANFVRPACSWFRFGNQIFTAFPGRLCVAVD
jgi:hypothetical protein